MKNKAVRIYGKMDLRMDEYDLPDVQDGDILIRIVTDSICMSSHKIALQGEKHYRVPDNVSECPTIIGHEFCGEIVEVGSKWADAYHPGEKVMIPPVLDYLDGIKAIGYSFSDIGGDSTYSLVHEDIIENGYLMKAESDSYFRMSLVEPVSCILRGFKGTFHLNEKGIPVAGLKAGGRVAILAGCGPMGLEAIDLALHGDVKPAHVVVTDLDQSRLDRAMSFFPPEEAKKQGIQLDFINTSDPEKLMAATGGHGFDDIFVFVAATPLVELADSILAFDGCLNLFSGPIDKGFSAKLNFYNVHYAQHHVSGTSGSTTEDMREVLALISEQRIDPSVMITHIGGLDSVIDTTLRLPEIPGGKKMIYTQIDLPLTALNEFEEKGKRDGRFAELDRLIKAHNGLWNTEAEAYLMKHF